MLGQNPISNIISYAKYLASILINIIVIKSKFRIYHVLFGFATVQNVPMESNIDDSIYCLSEHSSGARLERPTNVRPSSSENISGSAGIRAGSFGVFEFFLCFGHFRIGHSVVFRARKSAPMQTLVSIENDEVIFVTCYHDIISTQKKTETKFKQFIYVRFSEELLNSGYEMWLSNVEKNQNIFEHSSIQFNFENMKIFLLVIYAVVSKVVNYHSIFIRFVLK